MADKKELIEAMKVIKWHCINMICDKCEIYPVCPVNFDFVPPSMWELEDGESND